MGDLTNVSQLDIDDHDGSTVGLKLGGTLVTLTAANLNLGVSGYASGYKLARGSQAATASAAVTTGLTTIVGFALGAYGDTATKMNAAVAISGAVSSGTLTIYRWKHTAPSTATLTAASTAGTVEWLAVGT